MNGRFNGGVATSLCSILRLTRSEFIVRDVHILAGIISIYIWRDHSYNIQTLFIDH
jgi:hypothetical protein